MKGKLILLFGIAMVVVGFRSEHILEIKYASHFPSPEYHFKNNPLSAEKIALGRLLFYDPILSKDNSISCASCHSPYNAFAHTDHDLSHGIHDSIGTRNAPALFNLAWQKSFMWDGAIHNLDVQALAPISHPGEMAENIITVVQKLQESKRYPTAFYSAWKDSIITGEHFLKSLAQFQLTLISDNSKYDRVIDGLEEFTSQEKLGYRIFKDNCSSCHKEPLFSTYEFANNGLAPDPTLNDSGKYGITKNPKDRQAFKIPSLRNLKFSYPYMHDGRFKKLNEVLNHYNSLHGNENKNIGIKEPLNLSSRDKADLIAFLNTLNDESFVFDSRHNFPNQLKKNNP